MTHLFVFIVPTTFLLSFIVAFVRKVHVYDSFTDGVKGAIPLIISIFPYIAAVTMLSKLLEVSGIGDAFAKRLTPLFRFAGIPQELSSLLLIKPLSGSGAIAVLSEILETYGADSYISRCACVIYGSSETIFYIGAVYFAGLKRKNLTKAMIISVATYLITAVFCCFLCKSL